MQKKGFVLMETIVVIVVISVALLTIFSSYNKILRKVKTENKYDTSEYIYMTEYIKKYLTTNSCAEIPISNIYPNDKNVNLNELYSVDFCNIKIKNNNKFPIKRIYILTNINNFNKDINSASLNGFSVDNVTKNSDLFDAYMIDYIRKLDVSDNDKLLIVEYERNAINVDGRNKTDANNKEVKETFIASLEW